MRIGKGGTKEEKAGERGDKQSKQSEGEARKQSKNTGRTDG